MHFLPQCYSLKAHEPHTWGESDPDPRAPFDCPGLKFGIRFIDKFFKQWECVVFGEDECYSSAPTSMPAHAECGWRWVALLTADDMLHLGRAFDMSHRDIEEFLDG